MVPTPPYIPARWHGGPQSEIDFIVIHGTVSPTVNGGARAVANFFATEDNETSAHYVVDPGEVIQCVYDHTIAWHCGHNGNSLGVEMCDPVDGPAERWGDGPHQQMIARTGALVRDLCDSYGVPKVKLTPTQLRNGARGIVGHADVRDAWPGSTTHYDPGPAFPWGQFISLVQGAPAPAPVQEVNPMSVIPQTLPAAPDGDTCAFPFEAGSNSGVIRDGWVSLLATFGAVDYELITLKDGQVAGVVPDPNTPWPTKGTLNDRQRIYWKLPDGVDGVALAYITHGASRLGISFPQIEK